MLEPTQQPLFDGNCCTSAVEERDVCRQKHKINQIQNSLTFITDTEPMEVEIDPFGRLLEFSEKDNRMLVK